MGIWLVENPLLHQFVNRKINKDVVWGLAIVSLPFVNAVTVDNGQLVKDMQQHANYSFTMR